MSSKVQENLDEMLALQYQHSDNDEFNILNDDDFELKQAKILSQKQSQSQTESQSQKKRKLEAIDCDEEDDVEYKYQKISNSHQYNTRNNTKNNINKNKNNNNNDSFLNNLNNKRSTRSTRNNKINYTEIDDDVIENFSSTPFHSNDNSNNGKLNNNNNTNNKNKLNNNNHGKLTNNKKNDIKQQQSKLELENRTRQRELQDAEYIESQIIDQSKEQYEKDLITQSLRKLEEEEKLKLTKEKIFESLQNFVEDYNKNNKNNNDNNDNNEKIKFRIQFPKNIKEFMMKSTDNSEILKKLIIFEIMKMNKEEGKEVERTEKYNFKIFRTYPRTEILFDTNKSIKDIGIGCESYRIEIL